MRFPLKEELLRRGITVNDLAKQCRLNRTYLSAIVNGHRQNIKPGVMIKLASALNMSMQELQTLLATPFKQSTLPPEQLPEHILNALDADDDNWSYINEVIQNFSDHSFKIPLISYLIAWREGIQLKSQGNYPHAIEILTYAHSFKSHTELERRWKARIMVNLAETYLYINDYRNAMKMFRNSLRIWDTGMQTGQVYLGLGIWYHRNRHYQSAKNFYEKAVNIGNPCVKIEALTQLADLSLLNNDNTGITRKYLLNAYIYSKKTEKIQCKALLYLHLGKYYLQKERFSLAKKLLIKSIRMAKETNIRRLTVLSEIALGNYYVVTHQLKRSANLFARLEPKVDFELKVQALYLIGLAKHCFADSNINRALLLLENFYHLTKDTYVVDYNECMEGYFLLRHCSLIKHNYIQADFYLDEMKRVRANAKPSRPLEF